ncbi:uncharacterized protein LOC112348561 isoform X1 [Selaginella moellendorffii]|uniref:uncharacterized protein LOC112348561 isoform X1 n=1 Tax=Selaginella moellendorffii TaxID=88036 RepID=UPI000D1CDBDA|nr:uncharacterized protein LOC112348561 isoform X1 [Selaginella moellendorffii]XP_024537102.1 uncharacterized protein LOC112348561 isoform X1 [Selaginella moellendorffii]XP_024537103.1 uncharacterized protein LOC112348561 isoform X1 [Selaginella moellendorffii]|eukprot:XP_024537101.1 uncharacterized protein LOC112348561 isoform X1 [Selaginella moellendorffii]
MQAPSTASGSRFLELRWKASKDALVPAAALPKISKKPKVSLSCSSDFFLSRRAIANAGAPAAAARNGSCRGDGDRSRKVCIVWFKKDLRMDDHPGLVAAASSGYDAVIPLFVFDPMLFRGWSQDFVEALVEAVADLKLALQAAGSDLAIRVGSAQDVMYKLVHQVNPRDVFTEDEIEEGPRKIVCDTWSVLKAKCQNEPALRQWTASLHENQDLEFISDDYRKYKAVQYSLVSPVGAPSLLPPLPGDLNKGSIPAVEDFILLVNQSQQTILKEKDARETLMCLQRSPRTTRRRPLWLRKLNAWFSKVTANNLSGVEHDVFVGCGATDALHALRAFLQFPQPSTHNWRMTQHLQRKKDVSFRSTFGKVLALGTISLRRMHHEALLYSTSKWVSSQTVTTAINEVKLIEWYSLLQRKTQLQEARNGWQVKTWKWRGFLIQYTTCGDEGPAVVLVHGFGAFWQHYRDNIRELAGNKNRVWAITMLGFGRSEKPGIIYTELLWAELLRDFIVEVVGEPVVLVGNSLGGYIATMVAGFWSSLVKSLVLLNTAGIVDPNYEFVAKAVKRKGIPRASLQVLLFFLQQQCASAFKLCYPSHSERVDECILGEALRASFDPGATSVLESMFYLRLPLPLNFLLNQYEGKTLIVQGIFDPLQNAFRKARALQACCKDITVSIVNAGHCPHDEVPEEVNRIISGWVKDTSSKPVDGRAITGTRRCTTGRRIMEGRFE